MFKIDKTTHVLILLTFSTIFVSIYMYYTIYDVKQLSKKVTSLSTEVLNLKVKVDMNDSNSKRVSEQPPATKSIPEVVKSCPIVIKSEPVVPKSEPVQTVYNVTAPHNSDNDSVNTDELKKIINDSDDIIEVDENYEGIDNDEYEEEAVDLHTLKLDQLKNMCKENGLSYKGSKDQVITRLEDFLQMK